MNKKNSVIIVLIIVLTISIDSKKVLNFFIEFSDKCFISELTPLVKDLSNKFYLKSQSFKPDFPLI